MYDIEDFLPDVELEPGTNVLFAGPRAQAREMALDVLERGIDHGSGAIVVTATDSAETVLEERSLRDGDSVGVVDCVTRQRGVGVVENDPRISYVSSPADVTGIGIELSAFLEAFDERNVDGTRVLLDSISTLLAHAELETVFRFLHVFTGRVRSSDAVGLYVVDPTSQDAQTMATLEQLFDDVIECDGHETETSGPAV